MPDMAFAAFCFCRVDFRHFPHLAPKKVIFVNNGW